MNTFETVFMKLGARGVDLVCIDDLGLVYPKLSGVFLFIVAS